MSETTYTIRGVGGTPMDTTTDADKAEAYSREGFRVTAVTHG